MPSFYEYRAGERPVEVAGNWASVPEECATVRAWEIAARLIERAAGKIAAAAARRGSPRDVGDIVAELDDIAGGLFARASNATTLFPMGKRPRRGVADEC